MSDYTMREVVTYWTEVAIPNPTNWGELGKAWRVVSGQLPMDGPDDLVTILATDDEIIFRYRSDAVVPKDDVAVEAP